MKITVAGVGYVGLSLAVLFAQRHEVTAITTTPKKADKLNDFISPIQDDEIERFFREVKEGRRKLKSLSLLQLLPIMMMNTISLTQVPWRMLSRMY